MKNRASNYFPLYMLLLFFSAIIVHKIRCVFLEKKEHKLEIRKLRVKITDILMIVIK